MPYINGIVRPEEGKRGAVTEKAKVMFWMTVNNGITFLFNVL